MQNRLDQTPAVCSNSFTVAKPQRRNLTETRFIKCDKLQRKNKYDGGFYCQLSVLVCAVYCSEKHKRNRKCVKSRVRGKLWLAAEFVSCQSTSHLTGAVVGIFVRGPCHSWSYFSHPDQRERGRGAAGIHANNWESRQAVMYRIIGCVFTVRDRNITGGSDL